jgi:hypothetical protein
MTDWSYWPLWYIYESDIINQIPTYATLFLTRNVQLPLLARDSADQNEPVSLRAATCYYINIPDEQRSHCFFQTDTEVHKTKNRRAVFLHYGGDSKSTWNSAETSVSEYSSKFITVRLTLRLSPARKHRVSAVCDPSQIIFTTVIDFN